MDLWRISMQPLDDDDMSAMIAALVGALTPGMQYREESRRHPYTRNGRQVDVNWNGEWVEVWECGLANPEVLHRAGLVGYSGLALGMGLDRLLMLRKSIPDIRLLRSSDPRVQRQMLDLSTYEPVSAMPPVVRDISIAVDCDDTAEDLGDRVRDALGDEADMIEEVTVLSETSYQELHDRAIVRLGMLDHQKNVLIRVKIRALDRTLTDTEANQLRNRVYGALHRGAIYQWA